MKTSHTMKAAEDAWRPRRSTRGWEAALAVGVLCVACALLPVHSQASGLPGGLMALVLALAHVACLVGFLGLRRRYWRFGTPKEQPREPVARAAWRQFQGGLVLLIWAWIALYVWLSLVWTAQLWPAQWPAWLRGSRALAVADVANTAGSVTFFYLYLVLDRPSVPTPDEPERDGEFGRTWRVGLRLGFLVGLASVAGRLGWWGLEAWGPMLGSFFAAIAMMYFFGRFDYRVMQVGPWAVAPLYLYVALQVAWDRVSSTGSADANAVFALALALKLYFLGCLVVWSRRRALQSYFDVAAL